MTAVSAAGPHPDQPSVPRSALFTAPGRPRPVARRLAIHNRVVRRIRRFLEDEGFNEVPVGALAPVGDACEAMDASFAVDHHGNLAFARQSGQQVLDRMLARGFPAVWCEGESLRREWKVDERHLSGFKLIEAERRDLDLDGLCALQERLLKAVALDLGADLLGGRHVTRLDRMLRPEHPRVTYREALAILNRRGFAMPFGEDLHRDAEAALCRWFGDVPFFITHLPAALKPFNARRDPADPAQSLSVEYVTPFAGETMDGAVREPDAAVMRAQLEESDHLRRLLERAAAFAAAQAAVARGKDRPDPDALARRNRAAVRRAYADYLQECGRAPFDRGGFGLGVARLLQYLQGLDSIKDAVVNPTDRTTFAVVGGDEDEDAATGGAGIA
ncbi:MAG: hypothetical protein IH621_10430 [Krumholzibacteria bacterium]|nr:hypothetical protein [Candidatus Krumholzibacteria bacterium]